MELKFGTHTVETDSLPAASVQALLSRGFSHYMGNEQASKVSGSIGKAIVAEFGNGYEPTREDFKIWREENKAKVEALQTEALAAAIAALTAGTIGVRAPGAPRLDTFDREVSKIVAREVPVFLAKAVKAKMPKAQKGVAYRDLTIAFPSGPKTVGSIYDAWLDGSDKLGLFGKKGEANRPRIEREAKRIVDKAKHAAAAQVEGAEGDVTDLM